MAEDNWDLYAIVRSCSSGTGTTPTAITINSTPTDQENDYFHSPNLDCFAALNFNDENHEPVPFSFADLVQPRNHSLQELQDSYKPFLPTIRGTTARQGNNNNIPINSRPSISDFEVFNQPQLVQQHQHQPPMNTCPQNMPIQRRELHQQDTNKTTTSVLSLRTMQAQTQARSRKKKINQKRQVFHVQSENLSNDVWAWRKYGQKPIKGSPYPRNYYRCSSTKGCAARKQVERSNTDPNVFIVSYTGDHTHPRPTHRNSLAGSTRNKFPSSTKKELEAPALSSSSPLSGTSPPPNDRNFKTETSNIDGVDTESRGIFGSDDDDDGDDILINKMAFNEDLIKSLQELFSTGTEAHHMHVGATSSVSGLPPFGDKFA